MNESRLIQKFFSSGLEDEYNQNSFYEINNNYNLYHNNNPSRNHSANYNRKMLSPVFQKINTPLSDNQIDKRSFSNNTPPLKKNRNFGSDQINTEKYYNNDDKSFILNYIEEKIKAIEKNIEYKRNNDQRELINIIHKTNNDKSISFNPIISNKIPVNRNPNENKMINCNKLIDNTPFYTNYDNSYSNVPYYLKSSEIMSNKFKKKIENSIKSQIRLVNSNIEKFKEEMTKSIEIIRPKKKSKLEMIQKEMTKLKEDLFQKDKIGDERVKNVEVNKIIESVNEIKSDINKKFIEESSKNRGMVEQIENQLKNFKNDVIERLNNYDKMEIQDKEIKKLYKENVKEELYQKKKLNSSIRNLNNEKRKNSEELNVVRNSENKKNVSVVNKEVISNNNKSLNNEMNKIFTLPKKKEILKLVEHINESKKDEINLENNNIAEIDNFLKSLGERNLKFKEILKKENQENDINLSEWKSSKLKNMKEHYYLKLSEEKKQMSQKVKNIFSKYSKPSFFMKKINIFRSYVYAVIASFKIERIFTETKLFIRFQSLKTFVNYYETLDNSLQEWVFSSIRIPYLSIYNFKNLDLDITTSESVFFETYDEKYIRLETRLTGFMDHLMDHTNEKELDPNIVKFLHLLSSDFSYIPKDFFFKYEMSRLEFKESILYNVNENQRMLILAFYVLLKILVISIFLDNKFTSKILNQQVKQNFKVISSLFYHTIINIFNDLTPVINKKDKISEKETVKELKSILPQNISNISVKPVTKPIKTSINELNKENKPGLYDIKYEEAIKKQHKIAEKKLTSQKLEGNILKNISIKLNVNTNDLSENDVIPILSRLHAKKDLMDFKRLANKNKYDFKEKILSWIKAFYKIIHKTNN